MINITSEAPMNNAWEQEYQAWTLQNGLEELGGEKDLGSWEAEGVYSEYKYEVRKQLARTYKSEARYYFNPEVDDWDE